MEGKQLADKGRYVVFFPQPHFLSGFLAEVRL